MLIIGKGIDGGDTREGGKLLDIILCVSADDCPVNHAPQDSGGILDWFPASKLNVIGTEKEGRPSQFPDAHFKGDPGPG